MNKHRFSSSVLLFLTGIFLFGCNSPDPFDPVAQLDADVKAIDARLTSTPNLVKHVSGVTLVITQLGNGGLPASLYTDPVVEVEYVGKLFSDGSVFDSGTLNDPQKTATKDFTPLSRLISGWQIALSMLPIGSKATVYIPSYYGYGNAGQGKVPSNAILIFDLEFKSIVPTTALATQFTADSTTIGKYLTDNSIGNVTYDTAGIWYTITSPTTGVKPTIYDKVKIKYTFKKLTPGQETIATFEEKPDPDKFDSRVSDYINGMKAGLMNMTEGSKATLYVPSNLGFAGHAVTVDSNGTPIPAKSNLVVDVELQDIVD